jgi:hypothetical protein
LRGSRNPTIQKKILDIKLLENQLGIVLAPLWAPIEHPRYNFTEIESVLSGNADEWSVDRSVLSAVFATLHVVPTVDAFAAPHNTVCDRFFSRQYYPSTAGVNFFAQSLFNSEYYFCCPPVALIIPCFQVFQSQPELQGLLLVPEWQGAQFWPVLFPSGSITSCALPVYRFSAKFFYANFATSRVFTVKPSFHMLAIQLGRK